MKYLKIIVLLFFLSMVLFLIINKNSKITNTSDRILAKKIEQEVKRLNSVSFIKNIFSSNNANSNNNYLYVYQKFDCRGCISIGNKLMSSLNHPTFYIILVIDENEFEYKK